MLRRTGLVDRLDDILAKSAIVSHPRGNRRFHHWIFDIREGKVIQVTDLRSQSPDVDTRDFIVWEQCECVDNFEAVADCKICCGRGEVKLTRRLPKR
jgi:hypothetical protein